MWEICDGGERGGGGVGVLLPCVCCVSIEWGGEETLMGACALTLSSPSPTHVGADSAVLCNHHGLGGAGAAHLAATCTLTLSPPCLQVLTQRSCATTMGWAGPAQHTLLPLLSRRATSLRSSSSCMTPTCPSRCGLVWIVAGASGSLVPCPRHPTACPSLSPSLP